MRTRFVRSFYVLAVVALAWVAGLVLLHLGYVQPTLNRQLRQIGHGTATGWLRLANSFIRTRRGELPQLTAAWASDVDLAGLMGSDKKGLSFDLPPAGALSKHRVACLLLCDEQGRLVAAWRVGSEPVLTWEPRLAEGLDLSELTIFKTSPEIKRASGVSETPLGLALFGRCEIDRPIRGYLVGLRPIDNSFFAELSSVVDAKVYLQRNLELPGGRKVPTFGETVWQEGGESLLAAQIFRDSLGAEEGLLIAAGRMDAAHRQARTAKQAHTVTLLWAAGFAVLMVLVIHLIVSGPTEELWCRIKRLRAGQPVKDLAANLRGEAWALAKEFEKVLARVERLSQTDPLTDLANRRSFQSTFELEFQRAQRYIRPLSLAIMDIDFFKAINDALGHHAGDDLLKVFGEIVLSNVRSSDSVARLGGDEFAILMPETTANDAEIVLERIRESLASKSLGVGNVKMSPTASIGVVDMNAAGTDTPEAMLDLADQALYTAKRGGRNQVVQASRIEQIEEEIAANDPQDVDRLTKQLAGLDAKFKRLFVDAIGGLISALETRDSHTANHSSKVRRYATLIAQRMKLPDRTVEHIARAAMLHDVGKIGLPDSVLLKEGKLDEHEWLLVQQHPIMSVKIMEGMQFLDQELPTVRHHHERFDGTGYPDGTAGPRIPLGARILSVADAFDAMTSTRTFRAGRSIEEALEELRRGKGTHFDPGVVDAFLEVVAEMPIDLDVKEPVAAEADG